MKEMWHFYVNDVHVRSGLWEDINGEDWWNNYTEFEIIK